MIISHTNKSIIMRTPKTGSTTLETAIRMSVKTNEGDFASTTDDSQLPEIYSCPRHKEYIESYVDLVSISNQRIRNGETLSDAEVSKLKNGPNYIESRETRDLYTLPSLSHGVLDDLVSKNQIWHTFDIIKEEQIEEYTSYAFIRNPLKRVLSGFIFMLERMGSNHDQNPMRDKIPITIEVFKDYIEWHTLDNSLVTRAQADYHKFNGEIIATPLLFENYKQSIDYVTHQMGGHALHELPMFKSRHSLIQIMNEKPTVETWINPYPEIRDILCERYHEDIEMWEKLSGKKV